MIAQIRHKNNRRAALKKHPSQKFSSPEKDKQIRKNPITLNEGFTCENCKTKNQKATKSCRNHCYHCLYSKHVDALIPGDRQSICLGLMEPVLIDYKAGKGHQILHECQKCHEKKLNKAAPDDDQDEIIKIMRRQNLG